MYSIIDLEGDTYIAIKKLLSHGYVKVCVTMVRSELGCTKKEAVAVVEQMKANVVPFKKKRETATSMSNNFNK